ncbi:MAG: hypothetical protein L6366_04095 [Candidatus Omnitrophica bacterium]|nr:hypothetical protein [Candidatus Omnitrophota bacterium]
MFSEIEIKEINLSIARIVVSVFCEADDWGIRLGKDAEGFIVNGAADIRLNVHRGLPPRMELGKEIFNSESNWSLYRHNTGWVFSFRAVVTGPEPYAVAVINEDFSRGDIYVRGPDALEFTSGGLPLLNPLEYPVDEVLMLHLLARGRGVLFHSCGIDFRGKGILFIGVSGTGKSTTANIWGADKDATVLSDDRIIVRRPGRRFLMYGTPWHGDSRHCAQAEVPLEKVFFLKHAPENYIIPLNDINAVSRLLVCSFPTFWDKKGMEFTLDFCAEFVRHRPCFELGFLPDESVLDFVKSRI